MFASNNRFDDVFLPLDFCVSSFFSGEDDADDDGDDDEEEEDEPL